VVSNMPARHKDWLRQARRDLEHARHSVDNKEYEWSCFAAQQAAEKAVKGLYQKLGAETWGHAVSLLLSGLPSEISVEESLIDKAKELDKHYIPSRYPNFHPSGAPLDYYTKAEAERAIKYAEAIISFCANKIL